MAIMVLPTQIFKVIIKDEASLETLDQFCNDHCFYNEWIGLTSTEKRDMFSTYLEDSPVDKIIKDGYWKEVWSNAPRVVGDEVYIIAN